MADENEGHASKITGFLKQKTGPVPNAVWLLVAVAGGLILMRGTGGAKTGTSSGGSSGGTQGTFSSTTTSTDPTTGASITYTAEGPSTGSLNYGGVLQSGAGLMPYTQGGDVYVNQGGQPTAPAPIVNISTAAPGPKYPPAHSQVAPIGATGGWWYTLPKDAGAGDLANLTYNLGIPDVSKVTPQTTQILASDLVNIMSANPQIDWTRVTNGAGKIPGGTAIFVPVAGGTAGKQSKLPAGASYDAPLSYSPPAPAQATSTLTTGS